MMQETFLTHALSFEKAGEAGLRAPDKILLENADLYLAVAKESGFTPNEGGLRETFFVNARKGTGAKVRYSRIGDNSVEGKLFEIGGPGKTAWQIRGSGNSYQVKDGQLAAAPGEIPLYLFGFLW